MRRRLLFVQGGGAEAHQWDARLVDSLSRALGPGHDVRFPSMPNEADPDAAAWQAAIAGEMAALEDGAILVGHSIGATILASVVAESGSTAGRFGALILIAAPYVGAGGWEADGFEIPTDLGALLPAGMPVHLFHGEADETAPVGHARLYAAAIPQAELHLLPERDHQLGDDLREVAAVIRRIDG